MKKYIVLGEEPVDAYDLFVTPVDSLPPELSKKYPEFQFIIPVLTSKGKLEHTYVYYLMECNHFSPDIYLRETFNSKDGTTIYGIL